MSRVLNTSTPHFTLLVSCKTRQGTQKILSAMSALYHRYTLFWVTKWYQSLWYIILHSKYSICGVKGRRYISLNGSGTRIPLAEWNSCTKPTSQECAVPYHRDWFFQWNLQYKTQGLEFFFQTTQYINTVGSEINMGILNPEKRNQQVFAWLISKQQCWVQQT